MFPPGKTFKEESDPKDVKVDNETQLMKENNEIRKKLLKLRENTLPLMRIPNYSQTRRNELPAFRRNLEVHKLKKS